MAVTLRLARYGTKKRPFYRIVAADQRARRDGRFLEQIGTYDPLKNPPAVALKRDRIKYWQDNGAQVSDTVSTILSQFMNAEDTAYRPVYKRQSVSNFKAPATAPVKAPVKAEAAAKTTEAAQAPQTKSTEEE